MGLAGSEAPRGALAHWIVINDKKIANYQLVVPSTWNASPRDAKGQRWTRATAKRPPQLCVVARFFAVRPLLARPTGAGLGFGLAIVPAPGRSGWRLCRVAAGRGRRPSGRCAFHARNARSALTMTATSIASWSSAPATGVIKPAAANPIATSERPMPAIMLWRAIASERRPI